VVIALVLFGAASAQVLSGSAPGIKNDRRPRDERS
jgi:hypothetical protein